MRGASRAELGLLRPCADALFSSVRRSIRGERLDRHEVRNGVSFLLRRWQAKGSVSRIRSLVALISDPALLLAIPAFGAALGHSMSADVLCGMYEALKENGFYGEDELPVVDCDVVSSLGTGGKEIPTVNVSTASAIIAASCGVRIVRSGTRGFFTASGSADFASAAAIPLIHVASRVRTMLEQVGFALLDGHAFSPGLESAARPMTKLRGESRVLAATLALPLRHAITLMMPCTAIRVFRGIALPITSIVAEALMMHRSARSGCVVFARDSDGRLFDELSNFGPSEVTEFANNAIRRFTLWPRDAGLELRDVSEIEISERSRRQEIAMEVLNGVRKRGDAVAELLALNAGALLYSAGHVKSIADGVDEALGAIESGRPYRLVERYRACFAAACT